MVPRNVRGFCTKSGSSVEPRLTGVLRDNVLVIEQFGTRNVSDEIQSYHDDCCLNSLLSRYIAGDINALSSINNRGNGDLVDVPRTLMAVYNSRMDMQTIYNGLPDAIKTAIGGLENLDSFYSSGKLASVLEDYVKSQEPEPMAVKIVKEVVSE